MSKRMISSMLLAAVIITLLCGCSAKEGGTLMSQISEEKLIKVAVSKDDYPYSYAKSETDEYDGIEVRVAKEIAESLGVDIELVPVERQNLLSAINDGSAHIALGRLPDTMVSEYDAALSVSYLSGNVYTVTKRGNVLSTVGALDGKAVICSNKLSSLTINAISDASDAEIYGNDGSVDITEGLKNDLFDAYICYDDEAVSYMRDEAVQAQVITNVERENYVIVMLKNNEKLMEKINKTLTSLMDNGIINEIVGYFQKQKL